ncbi:DNA polymerase III subunit gamma/tau [Shouchella shacheensis]|uniref:DNA polymerase III subunit gamma/tau n=1 Tax=Shouchella shacheensis TaxID=1649580 RepID=UPI00073FB89A|nr:DNA polymerase III subunit gamma/tau [Shouchella shacheensis]
MSYQALYRVWRPQLLEDVVGQMHITKTLKNALIQQKLAHAYLFSGPRGTGKTSAAKIIAKAINCERAPVAEPCNECAACRGITAGSIVDVIEIDAASNNGVDEIRDIRDKVKFAPSEVRYKVYIIDEVHMLSTGAFNALLKTLEEPPAHVIFILATTEPHKIPLTIISRTQRFDFKPITNGELVDRMKHIMETNEQTYEEEALFLIARAADGGMRDALSLLDQAISFSDEKVSAEDVLMITGTVSREALMTIARSLGHGDTKEALETLDRVLRGGKDGKRLLEDLIYVFRDMLLFKAAPEATHLFERSVLNEEFSQIAAGFQNEWLYAAIDALTESQQEMKWSQHPNIVLELALIKLLNARSWRETTGVEASSNAAVQELEGKLSKLENAIKQLQAAPSTVEGDGNKKASASAPRRKMQKGSQQPRAATGQVKEMLQEASKQQLQQVTSRWGEVMERMKTTSVPGHAWLSDSKPVAASETKVLLAFQNEMHRDMMDTKFRETLCQVLADVFGDHSDFLTLLGSQWEKIKEEYVKVRQEDGEDPAPANPLIDEAVKLVGEDLIEMTDK